MLLVLTRLKLEGCLRGVWCFRRVFIRWPHSRWGDAARLAVVPWGGPSGVTAGGRHGEGGAGRGRGRDPYGYPRRKGYVCR